MSSSVSSIATIPVYREPLSSVQEQVLASISAGANISEAATQAGVHRNSISYWRRSLHTFRRAFEHAQFDHACTIHEQAQALAPAALKTLQSILEDPQAPASVRLKAALAILDKAMTPLEPPQNAVDAPQVEPQDVHKDAQTPIQRGIKQETAGGNEKAEGEPRKFPSWLRAKTRT